MDQETVKEFSSNKFPDNWLRNQWYALYVFGITGAIVENPQL